jgi:hypothetical protein
VLALFLQHALLPLLELLLNSFFAFSLGNHLHPLLMVRILPEALRQILFLHPFRKKKAFDPKSLAFFSRLVFAQTRQQWKQLIF